MDKATTTTQSKTVYGAKDGCNKSRNICDNSKQRLKGVMMNIVASSKNFIVVNRKTTSDDRELDIKRPLPITATLRFLCGSQSSALFFAFAATLTFSLTSSYANEQLVAQGSQWVTHSARNGAWKIQFPGEPHIQTSPRAPGLTFYVMGNDDISLNFSTFVPSDWSSEKAARNDANYQANAQNGRDFNLRQITYNGRYGYQLDSSITVSGQACISRKRFFLSTYSQTSFGLTVGYLICNPSAANQVRPVGEKFLNSLDF